LAPRHGTAAAGDRLFDSGSSVTHLELLRETATRRRRRRRRRRKCDESRGGGGGDLLKSRKNRLRASSPK
jgi:hypothetical protein